MNEESYRKLSYFRKWLDKPEMVLEVSTTQSATQLLTMNVRFAGALNDAAAEAGRALQLLSADAEETLEFWSGVRARGINRSGGGVQLQAGPTGDVHRGRAALRGSGGRALVELGTGSRRLGGMIVGRRIRWWRWRPTKPAPDMYEIELLSRSGTARAAMSLWRLRTRRRGSRRRERPGCRCWLSIGGRSIRRRWSRRRWLLRRSATRSWKRWLAPDQTGTSSKETAKGTPAISPTCWQLPRRNESGSKSGSPRLSM